MTRAIVQACKYVRRTVFECWQQLGLTEGALADKAEEAGMVFIFARCEKSDLEQVDRKYREQFEKRCLVCYPVLDY